MAIGYEVNPNYVKIAKSRLKINGEIIADSKTFWDIGSMMKSKSCFLINPSVIIPITLESEKIFGNNKSQQILESEKIPLIPKTHNALAETNLI